jgi:hypothetical protein
MEEVVEDAFLQGDLEQTTEYNAFRVVPKTLCTSSMAYSLQHKFL